MLWSSKGSFKGLLGSEGQVFRRLTNYGTAERSKDSKKRVVGEGFLRVRLVDGCFIY